MTTILTFGDSNTHGTPPMTRRGVYNRYPPGVRWPTVAVAQLGPGWALIEEGLPGRTTQFDDSVMDGVMNGFLALRQALQSHAPIDVLTVMLGTNDLKTRFAATPDHVTGGCAALLDLALGDEMQTRNGGFKLLLIAPPPVEERGILATDFWGAAQKSRALPPLLRALAQSRGAAFLDAGAHVAPSPVDGVHLNPASHQTLGHAVALAVKSL
ncbi:MAG: SGNH/GDSL hydrolase family protein [Rhodobacteraceae bacterium]|nr:SGNH/GDSL hydrolase family protein [Paracoccaceae bacterium]